jgi:uncharacterized membrane protein
MRRRRGAAALLLVGLAGCGDDRQAGVDPGRDNAAVAPPSPRAPENAAANAARPAPPPATGTAPMSPTGYALVGTEPFWGGTVTGTRVRYMTPDRQFGDVVETRISFGPGTESYSGTFRGRPFVLTLTRGACSDGRADQPFAFTATLQVLGETRRGCADPE